MISNSRYLELEPLKQLVGNEYANYFNEMFDKFPNYSPVRWEQRLEKGIIKKFRVWAKTGVIDNEER